MALTLLALLAAALLLPGIVFVWLFYQAGESDETESVVPSLGTTEGIGLLGGASVFVHLVYVALLACVSSWLPAGSLPIADPYRLIGSSAAVSRSEIAGLFLGLFWLCFVGGVLGYLLGRACLRWADKRIFYGPLAEVIALSKGDRRFITAYVLTKVEQGNALLGYEGIVVSLGRDKDDRSPSSILLRDVTTFRLVDGKKRSIVSPDSQIEWLALSAAEWHNIAFRIFEVAEG